MNDTKEISGDILMGAKAIAEYLGITSRQLYRLVYKDVIPTFKLGGSVAARRSALNKWMDGLGK
ncbi:helix-turn-helix domain-containing protein [Shinella sp.]|uniref:helix-turn-helix domain-containing protein n=1 Tax=Shinella sp. TaxID=1870904 RepID=UPI0028988FF9|nr:helix-turn-helix domain-containing protein [Shinella sp.]